MRELTYPTLSLNELFTTQRVKHSLWRWLPASLALHAIVLCGWELSHLLEATAVLPIQSGQQSVSVQLVSATSAKAQPKALEDSTKKITTADAVTKITPATKTATNKSTKIMATKNIANASNTKTDTTPVALANLTEGVYSEATPQSSNKPEYPRMAILKNQQGKVVIKLDVDQEGQSHNIKIVKSSGFALLDNAVIAFAQMERFIPASKNNSPVKTTQQYSFLFKLI